MGRMQNGKSKAIEAVERLEQALLEADTVTDPAFYEAHIAEDILFTDPQGRCLTKSELVQATQPAGRSRYSSFDVTEKEITEIGATVFVRCRVDLGVEDFVLPLRFARVWGRRMVEQQEKWQILFCQITPIIS